MRLILVYAAVTCQIRRLLFGKVHIPGSILYKSIAGRYRPVSYTDGPITARYRFIKNANWDVNCAVIFVHIHIVHMGRLLIKRPFVHIRMVNPQTRSSSLLVLHLQQGPYIVLANREDPDQTALMRSLVRIFAVRIC